MPNSKTGKLLNDIYVGYDTLYQTLVRHPQRKKISYLTIKIINLNSQKKAIEMLSDGYSIPKNQARFIYDYYNHVFEITQRKPLSYINKRGSSRKLDSHYKLEKFCDKIIANSMYQYFNQKKNWTSKAINEIENHRHIRCKTNQVERTMSKQNCQQIKHRHKHITY